MRYLIKIVFYINIILEFKKINTNFILYNMFLFLDLKQISPSLSFMSPLMFLEGFLIPSLSLLARGLLMTQACTWVPRPLIQGRFKKGNFKFIVNKVQRKLAGWKSNVAAHVRLNVIHNHNMTTCKLLYVLPISICDNLVYMKLLR